MPSTVLNSATLMDFRTLEAEVVEKRRYSHIKSKEKNMKVTIYRLKNYDAANEAFEILYLDTETQSVHFVSHQTKGQVYLFSCIFIFVEVKRQKHKSCLEPQEISEIIWFV